MKSELRQMLLAPSVVGLIVGLFVGWATYGFNIEYGHSIHPDWQPLWLYSVLHAALDGMAAFLGVIVVFGLLPFIVLRQFHKKSS